MSSDTIFPIEGGPEPSQAAGAYYHGNSALDVAEKTAAINRIPTMREQLDQEIANTEARLKAMKEAREVLENAPALEVLQRGLVAMRRNY